MNRKAAKSNKTQRTQYYKCTRYNRHMTNFTFKQQNTHFQMHIKYVPGLYMFGHKINVNKFIKIKIIQSYLLYLQCSKYKQ